MDTLDRIAGGRTDLVLALLESGTPADALARGTSLGKWCAYYGDVSALRLLVSHGFLLETLGPNLDLNGAAFHGHWQLCEFLLEAGADSNHAQSLTGETALHAAASRPGHPRSDLVVTVLLRHGADPSARSIPDQETGAFMRDARTRGETPLHRAAAFGSEDMVRHLIAAGANPATLDSRGDSALSWASWHCRPDGILRLLLFGSHRIHPDRNSRSDHGAGRGAMEHSLWGRPGGEEEQD
jgi:uncharacterized protein